MRRRPVLAALLGLGMAGCGGDRVEGYLGTVGRGGRPPTTFYANLHDEPGSLDPGLVNDSAGASLVADLFEPLCLKHPADLHPVQGAAERYDRSDDNRIYRFHLRADGRWSDGKPVEANDFVYAWRRVLAPATGARMVTMLYPLKNAALFHQGKLLSLARPAALRPLGGQSGRELARGTALRVWARSPSRISVTPLETPASAAESWRLVAGDAPGSARLERLRTGAEPVAVAALAAPVEAQVRARGPATRCDEQDDYLFEVVTDRVRGWLPGCALGALPGAREALVEPYRDLPRYRAAAADASAPPMLGFVPLDALGRDPAVVGVRAVGERVLEVELERPTPYFLELVAYPTYLPVRRDVIEPYAARGAPDRWLRPESFVGNGPYVLDRWVFRYELGFARNPFHRDFAALGVHRVVWMEVGDYHAALALYQTGEVDILGPTLSLPQAYLARLRGYRDYSRADQLSTYWYEINVTRKPVDDVRVRRALDLGIDKQLVIDKVARGEQTLATHFVPEFTGSGYSQSLLADRRAGRDPFDPARRRFDPARGRALLAEAGYPVERRGDGWQAQGFPPLELLYNTSEGHRALAVAVQDMWKRHLGVSVSLRNEEWGVMLEDLRGGRFQIARFGWGAEYNHPQAFLETFLSLNPNNFTRWSDPRFDALLARAAAERDSATSIALYRQAEALAVDALPRLPLYFYTKATLVKPYVRGFYDNALNEHPVRWLWIDRDWQRGGPNRPAYPPLELPPPGRIE